MAKHRAITIVLNIAINPDATALEVKEQIQNFLTDQYKIEPPEHTTDPEWAPFAVNAASAHIKRDEIVYLDEEDEDPTEQMIWILDPGDA